MKSLKQYLKIKGAIKMTNKEIVFNVMKNHPCVTASQISTYALQSLGQKISPRAAANTLKYYVDRGMASKSPDEKGKMKYWLTNSGKEAIANENS